MQVAAQKVHVAKTKEAAKAFLKSEKAESITGILHLWSMDSTEEKPSTLLTASLEVVQALAQAGGTGKHWFITKGAQSINTNDIISPWQSQFWGFWQDVAS
ncbi:MAG: hypothetical protein CM15mP81_08630 [Alphaproteobacteria bacterium]|nr:MAG: hypothetical protein CM15mP81_08630 [Alphaproteobacteria bacterium]